MAKIIKPPTQEEMRDLSSLLSSGEPYEILGCTQDSQHKEITKRYRDLARRHHPDKQQHRGSNNDDGGDMMTKINNAYKILSNDRFREIYDVYLLPDMMEDGDIDSEKVYRDAKFNNVILASMALFFNALSIPFRNVSVIVQSNPFIIKPRQVLKSLIQGSGFFKSLFRGTTFLLSSSMLELIREESIKRITKSIPMMRDNQVPYIKSFINIFTRAIVNFPIRLVGDILIMSPPGYSVLKVIKDVILRVDQATTGNIIMAVGTSKAPSIQWKNLFYSLGYSLTLVYAKKLIKKGLKEFDRYTYQGYMKDPNNIFYRYSNYLMSNTLFRVGLQTILVNPLDVLHAQYPRILLDSWLQGGAPVPIAQNPIALAIDIYRSNNNGIFKFFNGIIPLFFCKVFEDLSDQCDREEEDQYDDDEFYA
ncbi:hypothetical protein RB653_004753 [Dictyostelium firmibasis]|uniref:J domain-containing protein n=1 Tax=Dictyostelium firmibasis TaxID=79012 RepID=A0AAN7U6H9_9MYCE